MNRLYYIFWIMPLFMIGCCGNEPIMLQYSPDFLACETATAMPAGAVFDPPELAYTNAFGADEINGVNLNSRRLIQTTAGYIEGGDYSEYDLYYSDHQHSWGGRSGRYSTYNDGYFRRDFRYRRSGTQYR